MKTATKYPRISRHLRKGYRKQRVSRLEKLARWTSEDVDLLIKFSSQLNFETGEVEMPFAVLVTLAFDARTPDDKAAELQKQVKERAPANPTTANRRGRR